MRSILKYLYIGVLFFFMTTVDGLISHTNIDNYYPMTATVVAIDEKNDMVIIENYNGFKYSFYGIEDWSINDYCSCIMNTNGTAKVYDDSIIKIYYERIKGMD